MNIFDILKEARSPSKPNNKTIRISANNYTDYTEDVTDNTSEEVNIDAAQNVQDDSNDYTEEVEEVGSDETTTDTTEEPDDSESTDYTEDVDYADNVDSDEDEPTDYTEDVNSDGNDENPNNQYSNNVPEEQSPEEVIENQQNLELLDSLIDLYYSICGTCAKLDSSTHVNVLANKVNIQVKQNFSTLCDYIYKFITTQFNNNTYVKNLYIYNYIIESYKINIEMLKKIATFE